MDSTASLVAIIISLVFPSIWLKMRVAFKTALPKIPDDDDSDVNGSHLFKRLGFDLAMAKNKRLSAMNGFKLAKSF